MRGGRGVWHKASVSDCLPLAAPIGLSPLLILTLCGPGRVLVVSTEPPDDLSCLTTPGVGCPGERGGGLGERLKGPPSPRSCTGPRALPLPDRQRSWRVRHGIGMGRAEGWACGWREGGPA